MVDVAHTATDRGLTIPRQGNLRIMGIFFQEVAQEGATLGSLVITDRSQVAKKL
jgi:hypothetical protein